MEVEATQTKNVTVELSDSTVKQIIISELVRIYDLKSEDAEIIDDELCYFEQEWYGSHSDIEKRTIRDATDDDCTGVSVLHKLKKEL